MVSQVSDEGVTIRLDEMSATVHRGRWTGDEPLRSLAETWTMLVRVGGQTPYPDGHRAHEAAKALGATVDPYELPPLDEDMVY